MSLTDLRDEPRSPLPIPGEREGQSLSDFAYNHILQMILGGQLPPGSFLQERKLAELLSISRTPVREAIGRLESEQLIERRHGRAPVVSDVSVESYVMLLDMRRILEVEAAGRATGLLSAETARRIEQAIDELVVVEKPTTAHHWAVDELVHASIADAAGNPLVASTIRDLRRRTHIFNTQRIPRRLQLGANEHRNLLMAVMGDDPDLSRRLMGQHLDNVRSAIIEYMLGTRRS
jgi:DNA-binding GntR family transcriptional regulator